MSNNFKPHPFVVALEALQPVFAQGFYLRSARDAEEKPATYPLIDYFIEFGGVKTYDSSRNIWRASFDVRLDVLVQEAKPLDWCKFEFLKDAQDRQSLHYHFENMITRFITLLVNPKKVYPKWNEDDLVYFKFDFALDSYRQTIPFSKHGTAKETGISAFFSLSADFDSEGICCIVDGTKETYQELQALTKEGSVSWQILEKQINPTP